MVALILTLGLGIVSSFVTLTAIAHAYVPSQGRANSKRFYQ